MTNMYTHDTAKIMYILRTLRLLSMLFLLKSLLQKNRNFNTYQQGTLEIM